MDENHKIILADFLSLLIEKVEDFFDKKKIFEFIGKENFESGIFGTKNTLRMDSPFLADKENIKLKISGLLPMLSGVLGTTFAEKSIEDIYTRLEKKYSPALANEVILPLLPESLLEKYRLTFLSKEELEAMVLEKTKANEELKELDKRKTEFLSVVAHQLRTPLSGLKWGLDLLTKGGFGTVSDDQKDFSLKAYNEVEHMIKLVEDMLSANKIEFSAYQISVSDNNLVEVIDRAISERKAEAEEKSIILSFKHPESGLPNFSFDKERMLDIFGNLLDNAIKYNNQGGKVEIECSFADGNINCIIKDNGIGIPATQQEQLFSRFFRAPNARTIDPNGNGLGLYIAKNMIELHGGSIRFESTEGRGTTFFITFKVNNK